MPGDWWRRGGEAPKKVKRASDVQVRSLKSLVRSVAVAAAAAKMLHDWQLVEVRAVGWDNYFECLGFDEASKLLRDLNKVRASAEARARERESWEGL